MESRLARLAEQHDKLQHQAQAVFDANLDELTPEKAEEVDRMIDAANAKADEIEREATRSTRVKDLEDRIEKLGDVVSGATLPDGSPVVVTERRRGGWEKEALAKSHRPDFLDSREYFEAFVAMMAHRRAMPAEFQAALTEGDVSPMIPENWNRTILSTRELSNRIRGRARVINMDAIGKERLTLHTGDPVVQKVGAGTPLPESKPTYSSVILEPRKHGVWIPIDMEAWDDAFGLQSNIPFSTGRAMGNYEEQKMFVDGNGTDEPQAITGNVGTAFETAGSAAITYTDLIDFLHGGFVGDDYIEGPNSAWFMTMGMVGNIRNIKDNANDPIFKQGSLRDGVPSTLLGSPIEFIKSLPGKTLTGGVTGALFYGDLFYAYAIGDRKSPTMERLNEILARTDQVAFKSVARVDGKVQHTEAIGQFDVKS